MKTTKSIPVFLFVLLSVQLASAYYCPSTGRWLSRDPIGEPGFQTLQMDAQMPASTSSRWINRDALGGGGFELLQPNTAIVSAPNPQCSRCKRRAGAIEQVTASSGNSYEFNQNCPIIYVDFLGLTPTLDKYGGCSGTQNSQINSAYTQATSFVDQAPDNKDLTEDQKNALKCLSDASGTLHVYCGGCWCFLNGKNSLYNNEGDKEIHICSGAWKNDPGSACLAVGLLVEAMKANGCLSAKQEYPMRDALVKQLCNKQQ
jgi:hypothetical protein